MCLDFVNTLDDRFSNEPKELVNSYGDLVRFGEDTGILSECQADRLLSLSEESPDAGHRALTKAISVREAMHPVFWALWSKEPVPKAALTGLNEYVQEAAQYRGLVQHNAHFDWQFDSSSENLDAAWWPIALSAAELLASDRLQFVRACASKTCEWLFLDESKNHRRRWCDMTKCGNRAKVQRFYKRQKRTSR